MAFEVVEVPSQRVAMIRRVVPMAELPEFFGQAFGAVAGAVSAAGGEIVGAPFGWYVGAPEETADVAAGFPVSDAVGDDLGGEVEVRERPGGRALVAVHVGPYETMEGTYGEIEAWMGERGLVPRQDMWEEYLSDPEQEPDSSRWETRIVMPLE